MDDRERGGERMPGLRDAGPGPEQLGKPVAAMASIRLHCDVDQEREVLLGSKAHQLAGGCEQRGVS